MNVRRGGVAVLFGVAVILGAAACGNGGASGSGGGGGGQSQATPIVLPAAPGQSSCQSGSTCSDQAAVDAYGTCIVSTCDAQYKQCFGADYVSGAFGGACKSLMDCASKCQSCDQTCIQACTDQDLVGACKDCITGPILTCAVDAITSGTCKLPCGPTTTTGGVCDTLQACCNSMSGDDQASCLSSYGMVKIGGDTACSAVLGGYTAAGVCGAGSSSSSSSSSGSSSSSSSSGSSSSSSSSSSSGSGPSCTLPADADSCTTPGADGTCQSFWAPYTPAIVMQACPSPNTFMTGPCPTTSAAAYCVYPDSHALFFPKSFPASALAGLKTSCEMASGSWCVP